MLNLFSKTFKGGRHITEKKLLTKDKPIVRAKDPRKVIIPLSQHIGTPCEPLVKVDDMVLEGQKIGDSKSFISAPVHSSIAGKVIAIEPHPHPLGIKVNSIVIENTDKSGFQRAMEPAVPPDKLSPETIRNAVREAGIVGLGGAAFPTYVKLSPAKDKKVDTFILNGSECEPYLTGDERLMIERSECLIRGMKIMMRALEVRRGYVAIEDNKPAAYSFIVKTAATMNGNISVVKLKTKYPQGAERQLVYSILRRVVPAGEIPISVGVVVNNVGTAAAIDELFRTGMPLIKRVVTVTGRGVRNPKNLEVKIGTTFADLIEECGGLLEGAARVIAGGPMMGISQHTLEVPVVKGCTGILVLKEDEIDMSVPGPCIRCGKCIEVCPLGLSPAEMGLLAENQKWDAPEIKQAIDCMECGLCAYVCPSKRPLVQFTKLIKSQIKK